MRLSTRVVPEDVVVDCILPMLQLKDFVNIASAIVRKDAELESCFRRLPAIEVDDCLAISFPALQWIFKKGFHIATIVVDNYELDSRIVELLNAHCQQIHAIEVRADARLPDLSPANLSKVNCISLTGIRDSSQVERVLSGCPLRIISVDILTARIFLEGLSSTPARPEKLNITILPDHIDFLYSALEQVGTSIRELIVDAHCDEPTAEQIQRICAACPQLTSLCFWDPFMSGNLLEDEDLATIAELCPNLVTLSLYSTWAPGVSGMNTLARRCRQLRCVDFSQPLTPGQLLAFASHGTALEELQFNVPVVNPVRLRTLLAGLQKVMFNYVFLASTGTAVTAISFMSQLRSVSMHDAHSESHGPVDFAAVLNAIAQHCPRLQSFRASSDLANGTPRAALNAALIALFNGCCELTEFCMSRRLGNGGRGCIWLLDDHVISAFPPMLRTLVLDDFICSVAGLICLVRSCKHLRRVTLHANSYGADADDVVFALAQHCSHVQHVSLYLTLSAEAVLHLVQRCRKLTSLRVPSHVLSAAAAGTIRSEERLHKLELLEHRSFE
jgi:hypothetical protein